MELTAIIEALLIASDEPLPTSEIARLIRARIAEHEEEIAVAAENHDQEDNPSPQEGLPEAMRELATVTEEQVLAALTKLNEKYESTNRAFRALERAKGWKVYTTPDYGEFVKHLFPGQKPKRLSAPAMETLAVVAYRQPVTKSAIDAVRGVSSDGMLQKLLDAELVKIGGRAELPGRPLLYETTDYFFEHFGIKSPDELPNALELRQMELPETSKENEPETDQAENIETVPSSPEEVTQMTLASPATTGEQVEDSQERQEKADYGLSNE